MDSLTNNPKKTLFDEWIQDDHILVHLDARKDAVIVPSHLKDQHALTLKLSILFQGETKSDENEISTYLRFNNEYFQCIIPWDAVWGMTSDQGLQKIWEKELPKEVYKEIAKMMLSSVGTKLKNAIKGKDKENEAKPLESVPVLNTAQEGDKSDASIKRKSILKRIK
jgi:hypothetical protein